MRNWNCLYLLILTFFLPSWINGQNSKIEKGTISFAIGTENLFSYAAGLLNSDAPQSDLFNFANSDSLISLKYFYQDKKALRLSAGVNFKSSKSDEIIQAFDDNGVIIPGKLVRNIFVSESFRIGLKIGIEKNDYFRKWRYYHGYDFSFSFQTGRNRIINGNPLPNYLGATLDEKFGSTIGLGPDLIGGFEFMFLSNASIGIELNWGIRYLSSTIGEKIIVEENELGQTVEVLYEGSKGDNQLYIDNIPGARIKALIYLTKKN